MKEDLKEKLIYSFEAGMGFVLMGAGIGLGFGTVVVWLLHIYQII